MRKHTEKMNNRKYRYYNLFLNGQLFDEGSEEELAKKYNIDYIRLYRRAMDGDRLKLLINNETQHFDVYGYRDDGRMLPRFKRKSQLYKKKCDVIKDETKEKPSIFKESIWYKSCKETLKKHGNLYVVVEPTELVKCLEDDGIIVANIKHYNMQRVKNFAQSVERDKWASEYKEHWILETR